MEIIDKYFFFDKEEYELEEIQLYYLLWSKKYCKWIRTSQTGKDILFKMDGNTSLSYIINTISLEYKIPYEIVESDTLDFCKNLLERDVISETINSTIIPETDKEIHDLLINITNYCNQKCKYCNIVIQDNPKEAIYLTPDSLENYLYGLFPHKKCITTTIYLTGGEPLMHTDLVSLLDIITSFEARKIIIWTNGSLLTYSLAEKLAEYNVMLFLSLDSAEEKINDEARSKGSYKNIMSAVKICNDTMLDFMFTPTITQYNLNHLDGLIEFALEKKARGIFFNMKTLYTEKDKSLKEHFNFEHITYKNSLDSFFKKVSIINSWRNSKQNQPIQIIHERDICLNSITHIKKKENCGAGINKLNIDINGNVYPCKAFFQKKYCLGNISEYKNNISLGQPGYFTKYQSCQNCQAEMFCLGGCKAEIFSLTQSFTTPSEIYCSNKRNIIKTYLWTPLLLNDAEFLCKE